ncbi:N-acetylglucosamine-6-phosphate deacetylase [Shouchella shacheensis]|uniref:N-acetylglucosamine-6-phosphate deacetylase n=1 Tax=Shouchella shacheensis TaxID=1649580 RepID=UPI00073FE1B6|nr:N-acetylglucosamine-6-phosphate deacetylase [Shouchella shacheensis]
MKKLLRGSQLVLESELIPQGYIYTEDAKIKAAGKGNGEAYVADADEIIELRSTDVVAPGFIDLHIHGAGGADVMDGDREALKTMANLLPAEGTTSFQATTITQKHEAIEQAIANCVGFVKEENTGASVVGIHVEGPFIHEARKGAQPLEFICDPSIDLMQRWIDIGEGLIKQVTLAPEKEQGLELVRFLKNEAVNASIGHSDAVYSQVKEAVEAGLNQVTHLYNGMRGLHHREPGVAGASLLLNDLSVELIVDGIHIHPKMVEHAFRSKGVDHCLLITDSMRAKGLGDGRSDLGGQDVYVDGLEATLSDGTLAGSVLKMNQAVRNMCAFTNCTLAEAVQMAAYNPAQKLGIEDRKGSLAEGKDADIAVLNENLDVILTICGGEIVFKEGQ